VEVFSFCADGIAGRGEPHTGQMKLWRLEGDIRSALNAEGARRRATEVGVTRRASRLVSVIVPRRIGVNARFRDAGSNSTSASDSKECSRASCTLLSFGGCKLLAASDSRRRSGRCLHELLGGIIEDLAKVFENQFLGGARSGGEVSPVLM